MKLFAGAIIAHAHTWENTLLSTHFTPIALLAESKEEALVKAMKLTLETYPPDQGYTAYATDVVEVSWDIIGEVTKP